MLRTAQTGMGWTVVEYKQKTGPAHPKMAGPVLCLNWVMKLGGILTLAATLVLTGCATTPPPPSEKVAEYYDANKTLPPVSTLPLAAFIGDSYTQGAGASTPETRWAGLVAAQAGWGLDNLGRGGTGYVTTADFKACGLDTCPDFQSMTEAAVRLKPAVVVVAGGQNDFNTYIKHPDVVRAAINATFTDLRKSLPDAKIIAVGPSTPGEVAPHVVAMDRDVQDAASSVGATYVSLTEPNVIEPAMVLPDKAHVNDAGHKAIAERVLAALR